MPMLAGPLLSKHVLFMELYTCTIVSGALFKIRTGQNGFFYLSSEATYCLAYHMILKCIMHMLAGPLLSKHMSIHGVVYQRFWSLIQDQVGKIDFLSIL